MDDQPEKGSVDPIREELQAAGRRLTLDERDSEPAKRAMEHVAIALGGLIENTLGPKQESREGNNEKSGRGRLLPRMRQKKESVAPTEPEVPTVPETPENLHAYTLQRVIVKNHHPRKPHFVTYILKRPRSSQDNLDRDTVSISIGKNFGETNIKFLDSHQANLYDEQSPWDNLIEWRPQTRRGKIVLDMIGQVYEEITTQGVRVDPDKLVYVQDSQDVWSLREYVKTLPFTGQLEPSTEREIDQQYDEAELLIDDHDDIVERVFSPFTTSVDLSVLEPSIPPLRDREQKRREEENAPQQEAQRKVDALLAREDVRATLQRFAERFSQQPGEPYILGITANGLVVAVREDNTLDRNDGNYFRAWVGNVTDPATFETNMIETSFPYSFVDRDMNEVTSFPTGTPEDETSFEFAENIRLPDDEILNLREPQRSQVLFYKATGGFFNPGPMKNLPRHMGGGSSLNIGMGPLFPLKLM